MKRSLSTGWLIAAAMLSTGCGPAGTERPWPDELPPNPEDGNHFDGVADPFYEGWYHKISLPRQHDAFFFIYGVVNPRPGSAYPSEAFVYCGRGSTLQTVYRSFPVEQFSAATEFRDVRIGEKNRATAFRFAGELKDDGHWCRWDVDLADGAAWKETMGWLTGQPNLETSWTVGTITARATGVIEFDGERFRFDDGLGYGDHNWGRIFPRQWIWLQANTFSEPATALAVSGGTVDVGGTETEAYMIGLWRHGQLTTFRTQDLDRIACQASPGNWRVVGEGEGRRIEIAASCDTGTFFHLLAPTEQGMRPRARESLLGQVEVTLFEQDGESAPWQEVFFGVAPLSGVEIGD